MYIKSKEVRKRLRIYANTLRKMANDGRIATIRILGQRRTGSYVRNKRTVQWLWLDQDAETHEIVGVYLGKRDAQCAASLWKSLANVQFVTQMSWTTMQPSSLRAGTKPTIVTSIHN